jgi:hypothetical protein
MIFIIHLRDFRLPIVSESRRPWGGTAQDLQVESEAAESETEEDYLLLVRMSWQVCRRGHRRVILYEYPVEFRVSNRETRGQ